MSLPEKITPKTPAKNFVGYNLQTTNGNLFQNNWKRPFVVTSLVNMMNITTTFHLCCCIITISLQDSEAGLLCFTTLPLWRKSTCTTQHFSSSSQQGTMYIWMLQLHCCAVQQHRQTHPEPNQCAALSDDIKLLICKY